MKMIIHPGVLRGSVRVSGAKNSALKLQAISLLTNLPVRLANFPHGIGDAQVHNEMLHALGKKCEAIGDALLIKEFQAPPKVLHWDGRSIRNTLLILGALLARGGRGEVPLPGGCQLGERKYDLHVMIFEKMGARVWERPGMLCAEAPLGLFGADINLPMRSTGATENAIICGCLAKGTTKIWNPHIRPEVIDLIGCLTAMGADIEVRGQECVTVRGSDKLSGADYRVIPDSMEAITWAVAAGVTGGDIEIMDFPSGHLEVPMAHLKESGLKVFRSEKSIICRGGACFPVEISTGPYPGINSDMQPLFAVFGQRSRGESRIIDLRFPGRYAYAAEMAKMGLKYSIVGDMLKINGGNELCGAEVTAIDLRAGAALLLAGLTARGETVIKGAEQIERGYDDLANKIQALGGIISCVPE